MDPGVVRYLRSTGTPGGDDNFVAVQASDSYYSIYAHVHPSVNVGDSVTAGQIVGIVDNTGTTYGPHSHVCRSPDSSCKPNGIDYRPAAVCP
jgi:murein DD-endopeptidase MepM/ murein hydrolase activator NlpD